MSGLLFLCTPSEMYPQTDSTCNLSFVIRYAHWPRRPMSQNCQISLHKLFSNSDYICYNCVPDGQTVCLQEEKSVSVQNNGNLC